ncbi:Rp1-like protein [Rhynchospora pubera]|uniref:Rp1-like protein n=1 Tax=Rhynchospora pubera TaxID=906938 RepID=A0AAV8EGM1_9POAL|nr:Rp1-like protein [Rhynchospora pubera]
MASLPKSMSNLRNMRHLHVIDKNGLSRRSPPLSNVGKITSLQALPEFHVKKEKGFELQQLGNLKELKGRLIISGLEDVSDKDEAEKAKLIDKNLSILELVWSDDSNGRNSDFETIQTLQPPQNLEHLTMGGYSANRYPTWLGNESIINVRSINLVQCNFLEVLPSNLRLLKYCKDIELGELKNLKELPDFPPCLERLSIRGCLSLVLICEQELVSNQEVQLNHQLLLEKDYVLSKLASIPDSVRYYQEIMEAERMMFKQIGKLTENELSEELKILDCAQDNASSQIENLLQAWWNFHEERINFIYTRVSVSRKLDLPSSLITLTLAHCNITEMALSDSLGKLCSLQYLNLHGIMSLVTLPSEVTMSQLRRLRVLTIESCWLLRSLGALHKLHLEKLVVNFCPCLEFGNEKHNSPLPSSLQWLRLSGCRFSSGIFCGDFPKLKHVYLEACRSLASLSIDKLTSVTKLQVLNCPDICSLNGLHFLFKLEMLRLTRLPKLNVEDNVQSWHGCIDELHTDNLKMLKIFSSKTSIPPRMLVLELLKVETFRSEDLSVLHSLEGLYFYHSKIKSIPPNFTNLSSLRVISFQYCPNISQLPELPKSVTMIKIIGCPMLKERCQRNGEDWPKIADIHIKVIE